MFVELADGSDKMRIPLGGDWRYWPEFILPIVPPNPASPNQPSVLFNAMINPLIPYAIQGAIWYQGEANASRAEQYRTLLPAMITDWRTRWNQGDFPFLIVQLAAFMDRTNAPSQSGWAELREAQAMTTTALPKVGLALAIDIGEAKNIHPKNKQEVGLRLGLAGRSIAYGQILPFSGPVYKSMAIKDGKAELSFQYTDGGLSAKGDSIKGFAIAGADGKFVWAQTKIDGDKVIVWADGIAQPASVRYAWANNPDCNLYNGVGLPAVPFRTDHP
jgi:sialate O-acetylesterase